MNAAEVLKAAMLARVSVAVDGEDLVLAAPAAPSPALVQALMDCKVELVALLSGWAPAAWLDYFEERAAIREYDGHLARDEAEAEALDDCIAQWIRQNPLMSPTSGCAHCGGHGDHEVLVPYGVGRRAWLHGGCWQAWHHERHAAARVALKAMGIPPYNDTCA